MTGTYENPFLWADIPDLDVIRVGDAYYMTSTTMHFSPGVPVMKSYDLVNWNIVSYVYDKLENGFGCSLEDGKNMYGKGSWASCLRFSGGVYYVSFAALNTGRTYIYKTADIERGHWERTVLNGVYYDMSLLFDDDGRVYMIHGNRTIRCTELTADLSAVKTGGIDQVIIENANVAGEGGLGAEGSHVYKLNGRYYIFLISWPPGKPRTELCYRSDRITGSYEGRVVLQDDMGVGDGAAQGGIVQTVDGDWYAALFRDNGAVGRIPVLISVKWDSDGWPVFGENGKVLTEIKPVADGYSGTNIVTADEFEQTSLPLAWQWNHNPDNKRWSLSERKGYLRITTGRIDKNITEARNTLTQRTIGPVCAGETYVDASGLKDGDTAGLALFNSKYGFVGVTVEDGKRFIVSRVKEADGEKEVGRVPLEGGGVWLKAICDFRDRSDLAYFSYSLDGKTWLKTGGSFKMVYTLEHFVGYRFALFCYASKEVGGYADFDFFHVSYEKSAAESLKKIGEHNPLITETFGADPFAMVYNDRVYVYMTGDTPVFNANGEIEQNTYGAINTICVVSSADLTNWVYHGEIKAAGKGGAAKWANNSWAPAATWKNIDGKDKFFLYFANSGGGIGVLTADSPVGSWTDPLGKPLLTHNSPNCAGVPWMFDPAVFVDDDGKAYLYFGGGIPAGQEANPMSARVVELGKDMISLAGEPVTIDAPQFFEDSGINKINGKYYYSYCTNFSALGADAKALGLKNGQIAVMVSDSPLGSFTPVGGIFNNPGEFFGVSGNNHHCLFKFKGQWYLAYHSQILEKAMGISGKGYRSTNIDTVTIIGNKISPVVGTYKGAAQVSHVNAFETQIGNLAAVTAENWRGVYGVDFGNGASAIEAELNGAMSFGIHLDSPKGAVIGYITAKDGVYHADLTETVTGVHDVYFVLDGNFQVENWRFKPLKP